MQPNYHQCEHSLFVSYAHDDNVSTFGFVRELASAIRDRLSSLPRDIPKLGLHFSERDGPGAGELDDELRKRIGKSFAMLLVVGDRYVDSDWCERELELFIECFGREAVKMRLLIAALSSGALKKAKAGRVWRASLTGAPIWVPMYEGDSDRLIAPWLRNSSYDPEFISRVWRISKPWLDCIQTDFSESQIRAQAPATATAAGEVPDPAVLAKRRADNATPWSDDRPRFTVAIGPCGAEFDGQLEGLRSALTAHGAEVTLLSREMFLGTAYARAGSLEKLLAPYEALVVPVTQGLPIGPLMSGGHAAALQRDWAGLKKPRSIIWYQPDGVTGQSMTAQEQEEHGAVLAALSPVARSEQAVRHLLFGMPMSKPVRIYIEANDCGIHAEVKSLVAEYLEQAWDELPVNGERPPLRCGFIDVDQLDSAPINDVNGVVLLLPVGKNGQPLKPPKSLQSQMETVMNAIAIKGALYPGCVAVLFPPPPPHAPFGQHEWRHVHFETDEPDRLEIEQDSRRRLKAFLSDILRKYQKSASAGATSVATK
jgi:hypothetical protein